MEIFSMGHTNSLVKVEVMEVQGPGSSSKSLRRLLTNTWNNSHRIKVTK